VVSKEPIDESWLVAVCYAEIRVYASRGAILNRIVLDDGIRIPGLGETGWVLCKEGHPFLFGKGACFIGETEESLIQVIPEGDPLWGNVYREEISHEDVVRLLVGPPRTVRLVAFVGPAGIRRFNLNRIPTLELAEA